jgi:hypothetical protein
VIKRLESIFTTVLDVPFMCMRSAGRSMKLKPIKTELETKKDEVKDMVFRN